MIRPARPGARAVHAALERSAAGPLSYQSPGMTREPPPAGWPVNRIAAPLGRGPGVWSAAVAALRRWEQYRTGWTRLVPERPELRPGAAFAAVARHWGLWSVNCCRVVYAPEAEDEAGDTFACAIGTLAVHSERGEERFAVVRAADETVRFELLAYATPAHPLARLGAPIAVQVQRRFARDAAAAMHRAVTRAGAAPAAPR